MTIIIAILVFTLTASVGFAQKKPHPKISKLQATKIVHEQFKDATIKSSELEKEEGNLVWSFDLNVNGATTEVWIDAKTGKVIKTEEETVAGEKEEQATEQAEKAALKKIPGDITKSEVKKEKGKTLYSFEIKTKGGETVEVDVDKKTNRVVKVETEEKEKENEDKDDDNDR